jgi:hypothetical protein
VAVWGPHHRDVAPDAVESDGAVRPAAFDLPLAFQLQAELGEEGDGGVQVVDDDGDPEEAFAKPETMPDTESELCKQGITTSWWAGG